MTGVYHATTLWCTTTLVHSHLTLGIVTLSLENGHTFFMLSVNIHTQNKILISVNSYIFSSFISFSQDAENTSCKSWCRRLFNKSHVTRLNTFIPYWRIFSNIDDLIQRLTFHCLLCLHCCEGVIETCPECLVWKRQHIITIFTQKVLKNFSKKSFSFIFW